MKTIMSAFISATVLLTASSIDANAQQSGVPANYIVSGSEATTRGNAVDANLVNSNAVNLFSTKFKEAKDIAWSVNGKASLVTFKKEDVKMMATFDEKGRLEFTLRYLIGAQIPSNIRTVMRRDQYFMNIIQVTEVRRHNQTTHFVKMEDENSYVTVRLQNNETDTFEVLTKAK